MADDTGAKPNAAAEAAGEAAAAVVEHTEAVEAGAQDAIATAQRQADEARAESERIARAALETATGQELARTRTEFDTWRTAADQRLAETTQKLTTLEQTTGELKSGLALMLGALKPADPSPSIPPKSETPPATPPAKNPAEGEEGHAAPPPQAPSRKKRLL